MTIGTKSGRVERGGERLRREESGTLGGKREDTVGG